MQEQFDISTLLQNFHSLSYLLGYAQHLLLVIIKQIVRDIVLISVGFAFLPVVKRVFFPWTYAERGMFLSAVEPEIFFECLLYLIGAAVLQVYIDKVGFRTINVRYSASFVAAITV